MVAPNSGGFHEMSLDWRGCESGFPLPRYGVYTLNHRITLRGVPDAAMRAAFSMLALMQ